MSTWDLESVRRILDRYRSEAVAPISALGDDPKKTRAMLEHLVDPSSFEEWWAEVDWESMAGQPIERPRFDWQSKEDVARWSFADRALFDLEKFVPDSDAVLVRQYLDERSGRGAPMDAGERKMARSVLNTVQRNQRMAHRRAAARRHDIVLWKILHSERPFRELLGELLPMMALFFIPWTFAWALMWDFLEPTKHGVTHSVPGWVGLFVAGWLICIAPLGLVSYRDSLDAIFPAVFVLPFLVAAVELVLIRVIG